MDAFLLVAMILTISSGVASTFGLISIVAATFWRLSVANLF